MTKTKFSTDAALPIQPTWKRIAVAIRKTKEHIQKANVILQELEELAEHLQKQDYSNAGPTPLEVDLMKKGNETLFSVYFGFDRLSDDFGHPRHPDHNGSPNPRVPQWVHKIYTTRGTDMCIFKNNVL